MRRHYSRWQTMHFTRRKLWVATALCSAATPSARLLRFRCAKMADELKKKRKGATQTAPLSTHITESPKASACDRRHFSREWKVLFISSLRARVEHLLTRMRSKP